MANIKASAVRKAVILDLLRGKKVPGTVERYAGTKRPNRGKFSLISRRVL
jgi:hypothetical protein